MKKSTSGLNNIMFVIGALLVCIQAAVVNDMLQKGTLIIPRFINIATFCYDLVSMFGYFFVGIIGVVMIVVGVISINKE